MTTTRDPVGDAADRSIGQLLSDMSAQTFRLARNEMRPAQQGFQQSAKRAGIGGGLIGIAGLLLIFAFAADVAVIIAALALPV
jgi:preprotein translocase subunit Sss1